MAEKGILSLYITEPLKGYCISILFAALSRRSSTASEKREGRGKSLTRSKSPFRSFRWKKSKPAPDTLSGHYSDDEENFGTTIGRSTGGGVPLVKGVV